MSRVAKNLRRLREARGVTQAELAERARLSREYISRIESAMHDPTIGTLERIAKALKVKLVDLVK